MPSALTWLNQGGNHEKSRLVFDFGPSGRNACIGLSAGGFSMKTLLIDLASAAAVAAIIGAPFAFYFAFVMGA